MQHCFFFIYIFYLGVKGYLRSPDKWILSIQIWEKSQVSRDEDFQIKNM